MRAVFVKVVLVFVVFMLISPVLMAQSRPELPRFPFQGTLRNSAGELVPSDNYFVTFRIYSDSMGGTLLWSETHPALHIANGFFNAELGSVNPCSLDIFSSGPIFLETQVGDDAIPLNPRIRLGSAPTSGSSQRVSGDVFTSPGLIRIFAPQPEPPRIPSLEMNAGIGGNSSIRMFAPQPEPPKQLFGIDSDLSGSDMEFFAPQVGGAALVNNNPQIRIKCDSLRSQFLVQRARSSVGGPADSTGISIHADSIDTELNLFQANNPLVRLRANAAGASMSFFDDGSERMGIEPSPFNPGVDLNFYSGPDVQSLAFSSTGAALFFDDGSEYMGIGPSPFHDGGDLNFFSAPGVKAMTLASNGAAGFFDDGSEYMGVEPSPFNSGGLLKMYSGIPPVPQVTLSSEGKLSLGTTNTSNILTIAQGSTTDPIADAWTTYSSRRWKTNIQPMQGALDKVMRLNGVTFDWKENGKHDIGLIAEEVGQVIPEIVVYEDNGKDAKSVDYGRLVSVLIEGMKAQQKQIDELTTRLDKYENLKK